MMGRGHSRNHGSNVKPRHVTEAYIKNWERVDCGVYPSFYSDIITKLLLLHIFPYDYELQIRCICNCQQKLVNSLLY